jgi:hypothetical protein
VARLLKHKEVDRYSVVIESDSADAAAKYEFEWRITTQVAEEKTGLTNIGVAFMNLRATIGDKSAPPQKLFGSADFKLAKTGFPMQLSVGGNGGIFVMPLLCLYLPGETTGDIQDTEIDNQVHVSGTGKLHAEKGNESTVDLNITFAIAGKKLSANEAPPSLVATSTFNSKTGTLLTSEGTITSVTGVSRFHVKHK